MLGGVWCPRMYGAIPSPFGPVLNESRADGEGGTIAQPGTFLFVGVLGVRW